jgi:PAT family beta-lactamase induction signal transducer AmpG
MAATAPAGHRAHPPPWLFGIVGIPYGVGGSFNGQIMPRLGDQAGLDFSTIGWFSTLLFIPPMIQFLYAPVVDIGPKRKHWLILLSVLGAGCFAGTFAMKLPDDETWFLVLGFLGQLLTGLTGSCNGGLLAMSMPDEVRGQASAWLNIGNLSGAGASAWVVLTMYDYAISPALIAAAFSVMLVAPAFAIILVDEPKRMRRDADEVFGDMWRSVRDVVTSRAGITGILLCISPVGTAALTNYFSAMGTAFSADSSVVDFASGPGNAIVTAIGAGIGGWLCDSYNRRSMYLLSGALTAVVGVGLALSPHDNMSYLIGVHLYLLVTGFCYSAFTATVLETIGTAGKAASTQYALFVAAGNVGITYVGFLDTRSNDITRIIFTDAMLNIAGVCALGYAFYRLGSFGKPRRRD